MDITSVSQTQATATAASETSTSSTVLTSDFEVFLQMLTTQARYQDPLEPIDSSEYAAQLAQFSMVEQQVQTNELMGQLVSALNTSEAGNLADWIGLDALTTAPVNFDGSAVTVVPSPPAGAEEMFLVVKDSLGNAVDTRQVSVSSAPITWAGPANGQTVPNGAYTFEIETRANGEILQTDAAPAYGRVMETRLVDGQMQVIMASGETVSSSDVLGLRAPET